MASLSKSARSKKTKAQAKVETSARVDLLLISTRLKALCGARLKYLSGEQLLHGIVAAEMIRDLALNQPNIVYHDFPALEKFISAVIQEVSK